MNKKKVIIAVIVLAIVVSIVGGMLAYFTNTTAEVTNTFTVGDNVLITLTEPNWVSLGSAQAQGMSIGANVTKDPTVTNTGTNPAYVFLKVDVPTYYKCVEENSTPTNKRFEMFTYSLNSGWVELAGLRTENADSVTHIYAYGDASSMTSLAKNGTATLFNSVTFLDAFPYSSNYSVVSTISVPQSPLTTDPAQIPSSSDIVIKAYAIQTNGLRVGNTATQAVTPAEVYACLFGELGTTAGLINPNV